MKLGTVVMTKQYGLGLYMYPHKRPVRSNTMCSFLRKKNKMIYHLPFSAFESYKNYCWSCDSSVDSNTDATCSVCHWVKCPVCGECRNPYCSPDSLLVLDMSDPNNWEKVTGFDIDSFFDGLSESKYHYLGQEEYEEIEKCCKALISHEIRPLLIVDNFDMILMYVEKNKKNEAEEVIIAIDGNLIPPIVLKKPFAADPSSSGSCIFCGEPTDGNMLCPMCADNID
jgi:hypothetical protein